MKSSYLCLILFFVGLSQCYVDPYKSDSMGGNQRPKYERPPSIMIPQNFKLRLSVTDPAPIGIQIEVYAPKSRFKINMYSEMGDFEDFNLIDLEEKRVYFKFEKTCRVIDIPMDFNIPNVFPMLNLWQMFAKYEGIQEDHHIFKFPNFLSPEFQLDLKFDKDLKLKRVYHSMSEIGLNVDIPFEEIEDPETHFAMDTDDVECKQITDEEMEAMLEIGRGFMSKIVPNSPYSHMTPDNLSQLTKDLPF